MIKDEKDKIEIAETPEEALWTRVKKEAEMLIMQSENNLIVQKAMKELAENRLQLKQKI